MFLLALLSFFFYSAYAFFSYSLTDPNLVLTSWAPYWNFQNWMWQTFFHNPSLLVLSYCLLIAGLIGLFLVTVRQLSRTPQPAKWLILVALSAIVPLFFSYNALSHDLFNYIFNAKMVVVYHADPHVKVALDFASDEWVRFMHNTHTPAPYGYGWTLFSLIPYFLGLGKFLSTWVSFRLWSILSLGLLVMMLFKVRLEKTLNGVTTQTTTLTPISDFALVVLHPLLLIEVVSNVHNDLWMMVPALASLWLIQQVGIALSAIVASRRVPTKGRRKAGQLILLTLLSILLLFFSISVKFASILLLPLWLWLLCGQQVATTLQTLGWRWSQPLITALDQHLPELASLAMLVPLLTDRSQQFHPWYFTWILVWLPFIKIRWWRRALLVLSFSSLFRYVPWLWSGDFEGLVLLHQKFITWIPFIIYTSLALCWVLGQQLQSWLTNAKRHTK